MFFLFLVLISSIYIYYYYVLVLFTYIYLFKMVSICLSGVCSFFLCCSRFLFIVYLSFVFVVLSFIFVLLFQVHYSVCLLFCLCFQM